MELKERKAILNGVLPKFDLGLSNLPSMDLDGLNKKMLDSGLFVKNSTGGLEPNMLAGKAAKGNLLGGLANKAGGALNIVSSGIDFFSTLGDISKNKMSSDEMMGSGGTSNESINGVSFQESKVNEGAIQNQIDATAKAGTMASMGKGAALGGAIGSVIPGLGTVAGGVIGGVVGGIAGLFGSSKAKREAERQKRIAIDRTKAANTLNRETAYTTGLRNEFNRENRTDTSQSLFHAEEGVEGAINPRTGATYKKHVVNTAYGKVKAPQNAWVSKGEVIRSKDGSLYRVQSGDNDTARAYLQNGDSVYSKKIINPETGNSIADDAASYAMAGQLDRLDMNLNVGRMMKEAGRRKTNLLPGFLGGTNKYKQLLPGFKGGLSDYMGGVTANIIDNMMFTGDMKSPFKTGYELGNGQNTLPDIVKNVNTLIDAQTGDHGVLMYAPGGYSSSPAQKTYTSRMQSPRPDKSSAVVPEITTPGSEEHVGGAAGIAGNGNGGAKKPGLFGKIKGVLGGLGGNIDLDNITTLGSAFINAAQRDARAEGGLRAPKSFVANPYEQDALQQLNSLHSDYYPVWAQNRELEGRGKSSIMQSGGLSAGQKMLGYMGLANQTQQNNASALFEHQGRENALRAQAARASLEAGNQSATRQQQAYQWDEDMLAKAHAAREQMLETSAYDRQNALTQYFKNAWEKNQFDRNMNLYESQQKDDHAKTQAIINSLGTKNAPVTLTGVEGNASMVAIDPTTGKLVRTNPFSASQLLSEDVKKSIDNLNNIVSAAANAINGANTGAAPKIKKPEVSKVSPKKNTTSKQVARKKITLTKDDMGQQFANVVAKPLKKESKKATTQAKPTEDTTTKSTLLSFILPGGRNLASLSSNKDIPSYSVVKQEDHKLKSKVGKSNASSFAENVSETVSKAYEDGQKKRKSQLKKQSVKQESKAGKSNASSFLDALSKLYAEGLKRREKTLKEQRGY